MSVERSLTTPSPDASSDSARNLAVHFKGALPVMSAILFRWVSLGRSRRSVLSVGMSRPNKRQVSLGNWTRIMNFDGRVGETCE